MFEIKGKVNSAICYATVIEDEAIEQIRRMCDYELTSGSRIRIMPDVHVGKGCNRQSLPQYCGRRYRMWDVYRETCRPIT